VIDAGSNDNRGLREAERCVAVFVGVLVSAFKLCLYCTYVCVSFRFRLDRCQGARASAATYCSQRFGRNAYLSTLQYRTLDWRCDIGRVVESIQQGPSIAPYVL
jgi:hypothetical protein